MAGVVECRNVIDKRNIIPLRALVLPILHASPPPTSFITFSSTDPRGFFPSFFDHTVPFAQATWATFSNAPSSPLHWSSLSEVKR